MNTTILLIRHGETEWNLNGRWQGQSDIPLNETGFGQARKLAKRLGSLQIKAIYTSDLLRASQTASILGSELGLEPIKDLRWRERNGGQYEGQTAKELEEVTGDFRSKMQDKSWAPPGGETNIELAHRAMDAFDNVAKVHRGEKVAVVSHGGTIVTLISSILGLPAGERARLWVSRNTGFSVVEIGKRGPFLARLNDEKHLDPKV